MNSLFREEVLRAQRDTGLGESSLATPLSFKWWVLLAILLAAAIIALLAFGHYTRRETVTGQLLPSAGLLTLSAPITGTVTQMSMHEGQRVRAGQPLVEIAANLDVASVGDAHAVVSTRLRAEATRVRTTLANIQTEMVTQTRDLRSRAVMLRTEIRQIGEQIALQSEEADASAHLLQKAKQLLRRGEVSVVKYDQYKVNMFAQQAGIKNLERQRLHAKQQLISLQAQLAQIPTDTAAKEDKLRAQLAQLDAKIAEGEAAGGTVLRAPKAGVISALLVKSGQKVASGQQLLSIWPSGSKLEARLLIPGNSIGSVRQGNRVVLRYQAYPYQKFGLQFGEVTDISRNPLTPAETAALTGHDSISTIPVYEVSVALDRQSVDTHGRTEPLMPGMVLSADILIGRARLWAWAFDPLRGLRRQTSAADVR